MSWNRFRAAATRRTFLKGLGLGAAGAFLSPLLARLEAEANGVAPRKRVVFVVEGNGFYGFTDWKRLPMTPTETTLSELPRQVRAMEAFRAKTVLLNGLANKQGMGQMAGHRATWYALSCVPNIGESAPGGITIDEHLAQTVGGQDIFPAVRLGAAGGHGEHGGLASVTSAAGYGMPLPTQHNPIDAYGELFGVIAANAENQNTFKKRGLLLDFMREDINLILPRLPAQERWKFERYLYSVETFQRRQQLLELAAPQLARVAPMQAPALSNTDDVCDRAVKQFELGTLALISGLTHVLVLGIGTGPYNLTTFGSWGFGGRHSMGHGGGPTERWPGGGAGLQETHNKIAELIAKMATDLEQIPLGDGTMFDHTSIVFLNDNGSEHHSKYDNYPVAIFGDMGGALRTGGRLIEYPNYQRSGSRALSELWNSVCHAMGAPKDDFAKEGRHKSQGPLPELMA